MSRYPARTRKPAFRWIPSGAKHRTKELGDDDWASDVEMDEDSEEEMESDDSLQEFIVDGYNESASDSDDVEVTDDEEVTDGGSISCESSDSEWEHDELCTFVPPVGGTPTPDIPTPPVVASTPEDPQNGSD